MTLGSLEARVEGVGRFKVCQGLFAQAVRVLVCFANQ
jgi:hypothetical protein